MARRNKGRNMNWYRMDLHIHTPASKDYQNPEISYLDILQQAELRGIDIIAFADHNTVKGYRSMLEEIARLEWLEQLDRMNPDEQYQLDEYRRLFEKILILPGFEFTATFGFHILGIFSPDTAVRSIEHILLSLNITPEMLEEGETNVGASSDVLNAYEFIDNAGGLAIAAHANSSHGVAMRGMGFGGQTRIAYTQDVHLSALEVTDLDRRGRRTTMRFFDGSKPEYPRPMRCIQGSDAHRLERDPNNSKNLGVGERVTEILLPELTWEAVYEVLKGEDFARTRPYRGTTAPFDHVLAARQEGPSIVQDFHESMVRRGGQRYAVIADICAFSNTNGGTLYIGVSADPKTKPVGVKTINDAVNELTTEITRRITPPIEAPVDVLKTEGTSVIRVQVPLGGDPPYAIDDNKIYVRDDTETSLAVRDEIVQLVLRNSAHQNVVEATASDEYSHEQQDSEESGDDVVAPRTGVEIVATEKRNGTVYHHVRDLRNGNVVRNVTRQSARKLWHYAIIQTEDENVDVTNADWQGDIALLQVYDRAGKTRYDLAQRSDTRVRVYFGVTDDGMQDEAHLAWRSLLNLDEDE